MDFLKDFNVEKRYTPVPVTNSKLLSENKIKVPPLPGQALLGSERLLSKFVNELRFAAIE